jgi:hypothetical protein
MVMSQVNPLTTHSRDVGGNQSRMHPAMGYVCDGNGEEGDRECSASHGTVVFGISSVGRHSLRLHTNRSRGVLDTEDPLADAILMGLSPMPRQHVYGALCIILRV